MRLPYSRLVCIGHRVRVKCLQAQLKARIGPNPGAAAGNSPLTNSEEEKPHLVEQTCRPAIRCRRSFGNPSRLFTWRRRYGSGLIGDSRSRPSVAPALTLMPVEVVVACSC